MSAQGNRHLEGGQWQASMAYRWLHSDRHFVGTVEQPQRQALGSEVINDVHTFDLAVTYGVTPRFSVSVTLPMIEAQRSSLYEHDGKNRHTMSVVGPGDLRLVGNYWLLSPATHPDGNFALGLGVKAPTGDPNATDTAYRATGPVERPLDQSVQPGDGGWGVMLEAGGYQKLLPHTYAYLNASYLINPQNWSDTETTTSRAAATPNAVTYLSVTDAYLLRVGLSYGIWPAQGLAVSLGGRLEGVPVEDWFGGSDGFRRPGYAVSIEPGITWGYKSWLVKVTAPVALERNRERSVSDLRNSILRGRDVHGDAAFADYIITAGISYRF